MQIRIGNNGPIAGYLVNNLPTTAPITVGAAGRVDASVALVGAQIGDTFKCQIVLEAAGAGLIATSAKCTVADVVTVRFENPSAAPIGPTTPHVDLEVWHTGVAAQS